jgi:rhodanese-related sulfurtransferase
MDFIIQNMGLVIVALASGLMLIWPSMARALHQIQDIGALEAIQLMNHKNALMLDVREEKEFAQGHIPGARHLPLSRLAERLDEIEKYKPKPVVVNCNSGRRSFRACIVLRKSGFEHVYNLHGGLANWLKENMPVEKPCLESKTNP